MTKHSSTLGYTSCLRPCLCRVRQIDVPPRNTRYEIRYTNYSTSPLFDKRGLFAHPSPLFLLRHFLTKEFKKCMFDSNICHEMYVTIDNNIELGFRSLKID